MKGENGRVYRFDDFEIDANNRRLRQSGREVSLPAKAFDILLTLVENGGLLVKKDDLFASVWKEQIVEESNLTVHISHIRKALGDTHRDPKYIITVSGYGYRFAGDLKNGPDDKIVVETETYERITIENDSENQTRDAAGSRPRPIAGSSSKYLSALVIPSVTILAAAVVFFLVRYSGSATKEVPPGPRNAEPVIKRLTNQGRVNRVKLSPDGKFFAYTLRERGSYKTEFRLGQTDGSSDVLLRPVSDISHYPIAFSADGNWIYYVEIPAVSEYKYPVGSLYKIPVLSGVPQRVSEAMSVFAVVSPDDKQVAFPRTANGTSSIVISELSGANEREIAIRPANRFIDQESLSWSADGQIIAFSSAAAVTGRADPPARSFEISAANVRDDTIAKLTSFEWNRLIVLEWLKDGSGILAIGRNREQLNTSSLWLVDYPGGSVRKLSRDVNRYAWMSLSTDSRTLAVVQSQIETNLWVAADDDRATARQITFSSSGRQDGWHGIDWTPDGRIVHTAWLDESLTIWIVDADGANARQLTSIGFHDEKPVVSADGEFVVFQSTRSGAKEIWRMRIDGSDPQQLTVDGGNTSPSITRDGGWVIYRHFDGSGSSLWRVPLAGGAAVLITDAEVDIPRVSPDGRWIACVGAFDERIKVAIFNLESGNLVNLFAVPETYNFRYGIRWSPDGRSISYPDEANGIWMQDVKGGEPSRLKGVPTEKTYSYSWSPDGKLFALGRQREVRDVLMMRDFR